MEIRPEEAQHLQDLGVNVIIDDFLSMDLGKKYDLIIGNPPFNQAIEFEAVKNDEERLGFTLDNKKDLEEYVGDAESCVCHAAVEAIRQIISGKFTVDEITTPSELWDFPAGAFKGSDGGPC